ncbi:hypothetical protein Tcan_18584 [Toxocara canis]|uniref:Uncharacterized protein n=1 Tax=Toxocara canis TaxID=6265 RepID=A0A0B2VAD0_TOXCA|nr:hypothetical protein Tcan_18584 [Toxocara canis]
MFSGLLLCLLAAVAYIHRQLLCETMFSGLLLCLLAAVAYGYGMAGRSKRSVGCNPADLIIEAVTKTNFGTPESNEKTALMIRSKVRIAPQSVICLTSSSGKY